MLPIVLDATKLAVGLAGDGDALERRRMLLTDAGISPVGVPMNGSGAVLAGLTLLYIAGADRPSSDALAKRARAAGLLVNVEDVPELCDFHVPATLRRGDLLLTVSTGGRSPGLVRIVREWLADKFGAEWGDRIADIGRRRDGWRGEGLPPAEISNRTRILVAEQEWLA